MHYNEKSASLISTLNITNDLYPSFTGNIFNSTEYSVPKSKLKLLRVSLNDFTASCNN